MDMGKTILLILLLIFTASCLLPGEKTLAANSFLPKMDLIKGSGPEVYVLELGVRHWVPDIETFNELHFKWENIKTYSDATINSYLQEEDWEKSDDYPEGSLIRGSGPEVYLIELGKRRWIPSVRVFEESDFGWKYIMNIDDDDLEDIDLGIVLGLPEPERYPDTNILSGPAEGEVLENPEVSFKYTGTNPLGGTGELEFETFLTGEDSKWQRQGDDYTEDYDLEQGGAFTFYVRAKNEQGYYDPSPASRSFSIGLSSYFDKIEIKSVHRKEDDFKNDYLVLENNENEAIDITDWTVEAKAGTAALPQAVRRLTSSSGGCANYNLVLEKDDEVIVSAGLSPIGQNFRTNKCTGYLDQSSQYEPSLDEDCPELEESEYDHLSEICQDFIDDLDRCEIPDYSDNYEISVDSECTEFLSETFNYSQCYADYHYDADFFENEWRVFLNKSSDFFDDNSDTIILKDSRGLTVDEYSY